MANSIRTALVIDLEGNVVGEVRKVDNALDKTGNQAGKTGGRFKGFFNSLRNGFSRLRSQILSMGTAIAGMISFAAIKSALDYADSLQKLAIRLNSSTEALSQYRHVAELSGVTFETLTMGWQRMTRRIAEAAKGTGEAKDALAELRLDAKKLSELAPEDQFEAIAERISQLRNESDKVRVAMKLFDSEGVSLIQTMTDGARGIREMRSEAESLGLTVSRDVADGAAEANDEITRLKAAVSGAARVMLISLGPAIGTIANWIRQDFGSAINWLSRTFNKIRGIGARALKEMFAESNPELSLTFQYLEKEWLDLANGIDTVEQSARGLKDTAGGLTLQISDSSGAIGETGKALSEYADSLVVAQWESGLLIDKQQILDRLFQQGAISSEIYSREVNRLNKEAFGASEATDALSESTRQMKSDADDAVDSIFDMDEALLQVQRNIQSGFSDLFYDVFSGKGIDSVKDFAKRVLDIFKRLFADIAAAWVAEKVFKLPANFGLGGLVAGDGSAPSIGLPGLGDVASKIGTAVSGGLAKIGAGIKGLFGGGAASASFVGPTPATAYGSIGTASSGFGSGIGWSGVAVPLAIGAFGFGVQSRKRAQRRERQQEFFREVGTGTSEQLGDGAWDFRGMLDDANAFFSTTREGWRSTIEALSEANLVSEGWGAMLDENGRGLVKIRGDIDGVKNALSNAVATGYSFSGSLTNAIEKGNNLRVSIQGDADEIRNALNAATAAGIGGFVGLEKTATGVSATLTGDIRRWDQFLQSFVNNSIQAAVSGVSSIGSAAGQATSNFIKMASAARSATRAASSVRGGRSTQVDAGFAFGGISRGPQLAWVSEGPYPIEAHVPMADGHHIPVRVSGGVPSAPTVVDLDPVVNELRAVRADLDRVVGRPITRSIDRTRRRAAATARKR